MLDEVEGMAVEELALFISAIDRIYRINRISRTGAGRRSMMDVECWMVDSFRIQNCSFKISQPVRRVRFQDRFMK